jgi:hypothetical protein
MRIFYSIAGKEGLSQNMDRLALGWNQNIYCPIKKRRRGGPNNRFPDHKIEEKRCNRSKEFSPVKGPGKK